ncbi:hypothetical protein [Shewanella algae]|uniref:hypothetical protein n=1 Tax=Shewanella algae TaxID=38313 RepID=UPI0031F5328F
MKKLVAILFGLVLCSQVKAEGVIDIMSIAGKSKEEVSSLIGQPTSCGSSKYGEKCQFKMAETEVVFIKGKADWITVEGMDHIPFSKEALKEIGLETSKPTFKNGFTKRWEPYKGFKSVSLFKGGNNCDYAYIKVFTN